MATKTQLKTESDSSEQRSRIGSLLHWMNHNTRFEFALGLALMYSHVIGVTLFHSWAMMWAAPIGVVLVATSTWEILTMEYNG